MYAGQFISLNLHNPYMRAFLSLCFFVLLIAPAGAQIQSASADFGDSLVYPTFPEKDPYFVFHTPDLSSLPVFGSLEASFASGTPPLRFHLDKVGYSKCFFPALFPGSGCQLLKY